MKRFLLLMMAVAAVVLLAPSEVEASCASCSPEGSICGTTTDGTVYVCHNGSCCLPGDNGRDLWNEDPCFPWCISTHDCGYGQTCSGGCCVSGFGGWSTSASLAGAGWFPEQRVCQEG